MRGLFEDLPLDCLAEILSFFNTPKPWCAIKKTCKQFYGDMRDKQTGWGMRNAVFDKINITKFLQLASKIPFTHIKNIQIFPGVDVCENGVRKYSSLQPCDFFYMLASLCDLKSVWYHAGLLNVKKEYEVIGRGFGKCRSLEEVIISKSYYDCDCGHDLSWVVPMITNNKKLVSLTFSHVGIDIVSAVQFADMLAVNESIKNLVIKDAYMHDSCWISVANAVKTNTTLKTLTVAQYLNNYNPASGIFHVDDEVVFAFAEMIKVNNTLTEFNMSLRCARDGIVSAVILATKTNKTLTRLFVSSPWKGHDLAAISEVFMDGSSLEEFSLFGNTLNNDDIAKIARSLEKNTTLKRVYFDNVACSYIGLPGVSAILKSLEVNKTISCFSVDIMLGSDELVMFDLLRKTAPGFSRLSIGTITRQIQL